MDTIQNVLQRRLTSRLPEILEESVEITKFYPDLVQALVELLILSTSSGDYAIWREIIEEPYG